MNESTRFTNVNCVFFSGLLIFVLKIRIRVRNLIIFLLRFDDFFVRFNFARELSVILDIDCAEN